MKGGDEHLMMLEVCEKNRIVYCWLTREEKADEDLQNELQFKYIEWKQRGYKVCTFVSGGGNLVDLTKELLVHNKQVLAKKAVKEAEQAIV